MQRDTDVLLDITLAAIAILEFTKGMTCEDFLRDAKTQSATIHKFLVIGEAAKRLSDEFKKEHAEMPWQDIARMRDKMIHFYEGVDLGIVWKAAEGDIPVLLSFSERFLTEKGPSRAGEGNAENKNCE